jgi:peptidoglycan/LPS O-acetylase OafA/YrhL
MSALLEHPALNRLADFESRLLADPTPRAAPGAPMGYHPSLDGLRAVSVIAVILYHAGFGWAHGGFLGVEVFFVVSGYLITSLLIEEQVNSGRVGLKQFWLRRARRLLPALFSMLVAVGLWVAVFGTAQQQSDLHRDLLPGIFYVANWGQIVGGAQYFGNFSPLRHLWSLAVEEQWYALWPLAFVWLMSRRRRLAETGRSILIAAAAIIALTWYLAGDKVLTGDRVNLLYLSTLTRSSGLLLGAGAAFLWRPWRAKRQAPGRTGSILNAAALAATCVLIYLFNTAHLTDQSLFRWQLPTVSLLSLVVIAAVVHPAAGMARQLFGSPTLVAIGKRSYGLYLWSWPISVACGAFSGSWTRFILAMAFTVVISEFCYQYIETPIRKGAVTTWFRRRRTSEWAFRTYGAGAVGAVVAIVLVVFYTGVQPHDRAVGGADVNFDLASAQGAGQQGVSAQGAGQQGVGQQGVGQQQAQPGSPAGPASAQPVPAGAVAVAPAAANPASSVVGASPPPPGPRRVVVVGDSQAHALALNLPKGIADTFTIRDGSVDGCSVYDTGTVRSKLTSFNRTFADCKGWDKKWAKAATKAKAQVALVVLGAWDLFDVEVGGKVIAFGTPAADQRFIGDLGIGITALRATGANVALLEVACMRPQSVKGAAVPPLPERGDDRRVAHLNSLLRQVAASDPAHVSYVSGPSQWCSDAAISSNLDYRWDGVHVYKPGAKLIYETIAPALLALRVS